jgi:hypothetical protein
MYIQGFILVPFASKAFASEKQTSDEFIQNYDPDKQYKVSSQWVYEPPKERMPKEGAVNIGSTTTYEYLTEEQIKEIETKCQISGCNSKEELEKANNEQKKDLEEEQKIKKLEFTNPEQAKLEKLKNKHLTIDQILKLQKDGKINSKEAFALVANGIKSGKISALDAFWKGRKAIQEFVKNNPEAQKVIADFMQHPTDLGAQYRLLALADKYIGGPFHGTKEFVDAAIVEPGNAFLKFAKEQPWKALGSGLFLVGATIVCIAIPPVGIAVAGLGIAFTGYSLSSAYLHGGRDAVTHQIFSDKTISMYLSGDIWGAVGRGSVEMGGLILANIPDSPARYIEAAGVIGAVIRFKRGATILSDVRDGLVLLKQSGRVTAEGIKVSGELFKIALANGDEATKLLGRYLFHNNDYALLGAITKNINEAEKIGGLESRQAALKKEFDGLMKMIEGNGGYNAAGEAIEFNGKIEQSKLPRSINKSIEEGTLIDPSYSKSQKYTSEELRLHEEANQHYGESSAHTYELHIDVDDPTLIQRATENPKLTEVSRYNNVTDYEKAVNESLNDSVRQKQIKEWLTTENKNETLVMTYRTKDGKSLGKVLDTSRLAEGEKAFSNTDKAQIILKKKPDGSGYYILTSFPVTKFE